MAIVLLIQIRSFDSSKTIPRWTIESCSELQERGVECRDPPAHRFALIINPLTVCLNCLNCLGSPLRYRRTLLVSFEFRLICLQLSRVSAAHTGHDFSALTSEIECLENIICGNEGLRHIFCLLRPCVILKVCVSIFLILENCSVSSQGR